MTQGTESDSTTLGIQVRVDHGDRARIATELKETLFAVAGAGSGKTRHLVERVVNVLLTGKARVDQLAVITFTESAAVELRERIARELDRIVSDQTSDRQTLQRADDALAAIEGSAITTLHGFARRILASYPFDAGLPPTFDVLDQARSLADLDEHWGEAVDMLFSDERWARAVQWVLVAGADLVKLRAILRRMGENWDRLTTAGAESRSRRAGLAVPDPALVVGPLQRALALATCCADPDDRLLVHIEALRPYLAQLERARDDELEILRLLVDPPRRLSAGSRGVARRWGVHKAEVVALLEEAEDARERTARAAMGSAMDVVRGALAQIAVDGARRRQRGGRLQFHDLLVLACELVRTRPPVRAALHDEYRHLFVDEYQDTDPLQAELVTMIAAEPGQAVGEVPWWQLATRPGALFFVGDPLQSIYSFRRADVTTFVRTLEHVASHRARLVSNFRSAPGIVEWINAVFERIAGSADRTEVSYAGAVAARQPQPGARCPVSVLGARAPLDLPAASVRAVEAEELAAILRRAVAERWPVGESGRPLQLDDVAVLVPTRACVRALVAAFERAGIDYRLESSSLVYEAREVRELFHVLCALDDPLDSASVVAALRTPGFGCGDDDLLQHRLRGGGWDYRLAQGSANEPHDPVRSGFRRLRELHEARQWTGVSELVARVVDETRQLPAALDGPRWREEWRRLRFVMDQARLFSETSPGTLRQYLTWVGVQRDEDAKVTEVVLPEPDAPAVSVMTIHAAKGLEFPFVAVVGLGSGQRGISAPTALFGPMGVEVAVKASICTTGYDGARDHEQRVLERERVRLLYVACTRAQNHLVVSVHRPRRSTSIAEVVAPVLREIPDLWEDVGPLGEEHRLAEAGVARRRARPADASGSVHDLARWLDDRRLRLEAAPQVISATAVAKLAAGSPAAQTDDDGISAPAVRGPWRRGRGGTALGRAVHAVLQCVELRTGEGLDMLARVHSASEGVSSRWQDVSSLVRSAITSPVIRRATEGRFWRELYVGAPLGGRFGRVLEGFVDLLFEGDEGLEVVDYKTDQVHDDEELMALAARYRLQGAAYAAAVQAATGRSVRRCTLLFLRGGEAMPWEVTDLEQAIADVHTAVAAGNGQV